MWCCSIGRWNSMSFVFFLLKWYNMYCIQYDIQWTQPNLLCLQCFWLCHALCYIYKVYVHVKSLIVQRALRKETITASNNMAASKSLSFVDHFHVCIHAFDRNIYPKQFIVSVTASISSVLPRNPKVFSTLIHCFIQSYIHAFIQVISVNGSCLMDLSGIVSVMILLLKPIIVSQGLLGLPSTLA